MQNLKFLSISAGIGFVLSLVCGFFSHSSFSRIFLIALLFACIFGILGFIISFIYNKFLNLDINNPQSRPSLSGLKTQLCPSSTIHGYFVSTSE